jgi:hypothetical protein
VDPTNIAFGIQEARMKKSCKGCIFDKQSVKVCFAACAEAIKRGLPDCDALNERGKRVVYVEIDPRQLDIEKDVV